MSWSKKLQVVPFVKNTVPATQNQKKNVFYVVEKIRYFLSLAFNIFC